MKNKITLAFLMALCFPLLMTAQQENTNTNKFRQLYDELPTPNSYRTASGAPGHEYYQQKADYVMHVELDDDTQRISGDETITYHNNSPDVLTYLWLQLDQNMRAKDSDSHKIKTSKIDEKASFRQLKGIHEKFDGGFHIEHVKDASGNPMEYLINKTMMRVDLKSPLKPGASVSFQLKWWYNVQNRMDWGGRSGYEHFEEDGNNLYTIAQFFPRMAVYNDVEGWQHKQFLGRGEFTLAFGDYEVHITVPADHVVAATGVLQNEKQVLTAEERKRFEKARKSTDKPVIIVTEEEAKAKEGSRSTKKKTWVFKAENVRDFGFASSRKFIWDAMAVKFGDRTSMAMSLYPKEGNPLWEQYSTRMVAHTLTSYSKYTFDYPYPVAWSIHSKWIGMEYPMICFNGGRPAADGTYSERTKYGMLGVICHEVGHNYFPMIVNSDERQWTWRDEGLNSFVQCLAELEWDVNYPARASKPSSIVNYMKMEKDKLSPIMTNSESIKNFGSNAYAKPATALFVLRETVMGHELFDKAFKEYSTRWMFKHPSPADFFRTMEDASAVDLDWFWRGWFYTTDNVDIAMSDVSWFSIDTKNPEVEKELARTKKEEAPRYIGDIRRDGDETVVTKDPTMLDFYNTYDELEVTVLDEKEYKKFLSGLTDEEKEIINGGGNYYSVKFENLGGLVMPIILEFKFKDGTSEVVRIPAEIWRQNSAEVNKVFFFEKEAIEIVLDPFVETADVDRNNNYWPERTEPSRFEVYKNRWNRRGGGGAKNPMQKAKEIEGMSEKEAEGSSSGGQGEKK
jgi:hypothetical protein